MVLALTPDTPSSQNLSKMSYLKVIPPTLECSIHHYKEKASPSITTDLSLVMIKFQSPSSSSVNEALKLSPLPQPSGNKRAFNNEPGDQPASPHPSAKGNTLHQ